jgi:soluble lytic murein transglycosylase-like protein
MRGQYVQYDPREWSNQYDVSVNVGLGTGNIEQKMAMLSMVLAKQEQIIQAYGPSNPLVSVSQYRATLGKLIEAAGFADSAEFFKQVTPEVDAALAQPPQQGPDPAVQMMMAQAQADIEIKRQKAMADIQLAREKALAELELKRMEFEAEAQMKAMKVGAGITSNIEIPG